MSGIRRRRASRRAFPRAIHFQFPCRHAPRARADARALARSRHGVLSQSRGNQRKPVFLSRSLSGSRCAYLASCVSLARARRFIHSSARSFVDKPPPREVVAVSLSLEKKEASGKKRWRLQIDIHAVSRAQVATRGVRVRVCVQGPMGSTLRCASGQSRFGIR